MDGAPVKGESIPIRVFLAGYDLTPTMRDINKKFSVKYYLNLVLVDEEERRYFKQQVRCELFYYLPHSDKKLVLYMSICNAHKLTHYIILRRLRYGEKVIDQESSCTEDILKE